jgi:sugar phosphate isomerase/epimerase
MNVPTPSRFGYKIVDKDVSDMRAVIQLAQTQQRPLEVGIYFDEPGCRDEFQHHLPDLGAPVNIHLDHRRLSVLNIFDQSSLLRQQLTLAEGWGADFGVTHVSPFPLSVRDAYQGAILQRLDRGLAFFDEMAEKRGFPIYIENTFHSLDFYQRLFDWLDTKGYSQLNFCFDIGHAKVWSQQGLGQWLDFLDQLTQAGRGLHFHLHANSGVTDEHLSLLTAEAGDHTVADAYSGERDFFQALAWIEQRFPEARKIFEVPPLEAGDNMARLVRDLPNA